MGSLTREELFRQASAKLRQDFREREVIPHNQLKGDEAAGLVRDFLNDHLPKRFSGGSGFIIDRGDRISKQTDLIIYDAFNCPTYRASEMAGIYPSDNVAAVVEVKSILDKDSLREAHENIRAAKGLRKTRESDAPYLQHAQTLGCVFAFESSITLDKIAEHLKGLYSEAGLGTHIDHLVVLDRGVLTLGISMRGSNAWNPMGVFTGTGGPSGEGSHLGILIFEMGEASLDGFFRLLLAHLTFFRHIVPHPGFNLSHLVGGKTCNLYLSPITNESDPQRREIKMKEYCEEYKKVHGIAEAQEG